MRLIMENRKSLPLVFWLALVLLLSISDQFAENLTRNLDRASELLLRLGDEYQRVYYQGILYERMAGVYLRRPTPGSHFSAFDMFREAMRLYEEAERLRPAGNAERCGIPVVERHHPLHLTFRRYASQPRGQLPSDPGQRNRRHPHRVASRAQIGERR